MPRPWGKLHAPMLTHRKFLRLSRAERGDWLVLILAAINSTKDDDLGTRQDVIALLRSYGNVRAGETIDRMLSVGVLDVGFDSHVRLHDWDEHQPADPTGAKRKAAQRAEHRAAQLALSPDGPVTVHGQSTDSPRDLSRESRSRDGDGDRDVDTTPPTPSPARGRRRRRSVSSLGQQYDDLVVSDSDDEAGVSWLKAKA